MAGAFAPFQPGAGAVGGVSEDDLLGLISQRSGLPPMSYETTWGTGQGAIEPQNLSLMSQLGITGRDFNEGAKEFVKGLPGVYWQGVDSAADKLRRGVMDGDMPALASSGVETLLLAGKPLAAGAAGIGALGAFLGLDALSPSANAADRRETDAQLDAMSVDDVKAVQQRLKAQGLYDGQIDGIARKKSGDSETQKGFFLETLRKEAANQANRELELEKERIRADAKVKSDRDAAEVAAQSAAASEELQSAQVEKAKRLLQERLLAASKPDTDTSLAGRFYNETGTLAPFLAGAGAGVVGGAAATPAAKMVSNAIKPTSWQAALGKVAAEKGIPALFGGIAGAEAGATIASSPLVAQMAQPVNPDILIYRQFIQDLPAGATDERARAEAALKILPQISEAAQYAAENIGNVRETGAIQGGLSGIGGSMVPAAAGYLYRKALQVPGDIAEAAASIPGRMRTGAFRSGAAAEGERAAFNRAALTSDVADAERAALARSEELANGLHSDLMTTPVDALIAEGTLKMPRIAPDPYGGASAAYGVGRTITSRSPGSTGGGSSLPSGGGVPAGGPAQIAPPVQQPVVQPPPAPPVGPNGPPSPGGGGGPVGGGGARQGSAKVNQGEQKQLLATLESGGDLSTLPQRLQNEAAYLQGLSKRIGTSFKEMREMLEDGRKKGLWAVPAAAGAGAGAASSSDDWSDIMDRLRVGKPIKEKRSSGGGYSDTVKSLRDRLG